MGDVKVGNTAGISIVDFGGFLDGTRKQAVADAMVESFKNIGFVYLVNHGLSQGKIDSTFEWVRYTQCFPLSLLLITLCEITVEAFLRSTYRHQTSRPAPCIRSPS